MTSQKQSPQKRGLQAKNLDLNAKIQQSNTFFLWGVEAVLLSPNPWPFSGKPIHHHKVERLERQWLMSEQQVAITCGFSIAFFFVPFVEAYPQCLRVQKRRLLETVHRFLFFLGGTWAVHESACRWWFLPATADRYSWTSSKLGESWRLQYILFGKLPLPRSVLFKPAKMEFHWNDAVNW